jgi:hypothetical protein
MIIMECHTRATDVGEADIGGCRDRSAVAEPSPWLEPADRCQPIEVQAAGRNIALGISLVQARSVIPDLRFTCEGAQARFMPTRAAVPVRTLKQH